MTIIALGVDPGFQHMGICVLTLDTAAETPKPEVLDLAVIKAPKTSNKNLRVTQDDVNRMHRLWLPVQQAVLQFRPQVIGVETYTVYKPGQGGHGKGAGWKAAFLYAITCGVGFAHDIPVHPYLPADLKRRVGGKKDASKADIERALIPQVTGLEQWLDGIPPALQEHAADSCGHGLMALRDYYDALDTATT